MKKSARIYFDWYLTFLFFLAGFFFDDFIKIFN